MEEAARLLYREWFVHFRFPGHEHVRITDGLPEGWERVGLFDKFDTTSGGTPSRQRPEFFEGEINWVKTQELDERPIFSTSEKITEEAIARSSAKVLPAKTLLVSIYGNTNIALEYSQFLELPTKHVSHFCQGEDLKITSMRSYGYRTLETT